MITEEQITACKKMQRQAQRQIYEHLAPKLYRVCKRYLKKEEEIEEVLADAFYIIFTKINQLKETKAFEGWAKKIVVNECLHQLRKNVNFNIYLEDISPSTSIAFEEEKPLYEEDLLKLLDYLPQGCKTVFKLFVIEGFAHKEIAEMLNISEGTSKSQLNFAKLKLRELVNTHYYQQAK